MRRLSAAIHSSDHGVCVCAGCEAYTDVSEFNLNTNLLVFGSITCSAILKCGRLCTVTSSDTSPCLSRNVVPDSMERDSSVSQMRFHV